MGRLCKQELGYTMKRITVILSLLAATLAATVGYGQPAPQTAPAIVEEHGVVMKTRDGITLRADVYRPAGEGKFPVLLQRTPYNKANTADFARKAARAGFVVVAQDVRGRFTSEGDWYPFKYEEADGYDAVEWAANLPNANGKVGMFGGSYVGATQMLTAVGHPPHLAGICPVVTASNYHENWTYQGGAFEQWFNESWTSGLAQDTADRVIRQGTNAMVGSRMLPLVEYPVFNLTLPSSPSGLTRDLAPYFQDWLAHPGYDSYWKQWAIEEQYEQIQVPSLTVAAWYDIFLGGSLRNFTGLKAHAGNEGARKNQRLLVTIGGHSGGGRHIGSVDFGAEAEAYNEDAITLAWYQYLLRGEQNEYASQKPVKIFVMGENKWREEESWPLDRAKATRFYLSSAGKANSANGDGALSTMPAKGEAADTFVYDPDNPVATTGGPLCCDGDHLAPGPRDQRAVETRPDVLVYSTPPLDQDTEVTGPITLELYAATSAVDTDFTAKLVDIGPDGFAQNLTEGILRGRYRESTTEAKLLDPGKKYLFHIDMWATSNVFLKGHRIRVEVSSSNFPRFDRNLNTGKVAATDQTMVKATNTVFHDKDHPSALVLPLVSR